MICLLVTGTSMLDKAPAPAGFKALLVTEMAVIFISIGTVTVMGGVSLIKRGKTGTPADFWILRRAPELGAFAATIKKVAADMVACETLPQILEEMLIYDIQALEYVMNLMVTADVSNQSLERKVSRILSFTGAAAEPAEEPRQPQPSDNDPPGQIRRRQITPVEADPAEGQAALEV